MQAVAAAGSFNAGIGAYTRDASTARIDQQLAWTFGRLTTQRLAALCWVFDPDRAEPVDVEPFVGLAARDGTPYLSRSECALLGEQLTVVYRERQVAAEARKRFTRMLHCTDADVIELRDALRQIFLNAAREATLGSTKVAPIVLLHTDSPEDGCVTHEVALHLAVLFGIVEDLDEDRTLRLDPLIQT